MYWNRSAAEIAAAWQTEIETKLEAGAPPLLTAGMSSLAYSGIVTLLAFQLLERRRADLTAPVLAAGGSGALWLGLLLGPNSEPGAPEPSVVYAGPDPATYLAGIATLSTGALAAPAAVATGAPPDMALWLAPRLQPGAPAPWEALPFAEVGERPLPPLAEPGSAARATGETDPTAGWIAWGAMLLALCLVLSALLI